MSLFKDIKKYIPDNITIPKELKLLCEWVEKNGYPIGGDLELFPDKDNILKEVQGYEKCHDKLGVFGCDGICNYALWQEGDEPPKVVVIEEFDVIAENFSDFIRLLAIGYGQLSCADLDITLEEYNDDNDEDEYYHSVSPKFRNWVTNKLGLTIPEKGDEIVDTKDRSFDDWVTFYE
jgi:hypothetical protein